MKFRTIALALAVLPLTAGSRAAIGQDAVRPAARIRVQITEFKFTPRNAQVHVGDTIVWTNNGTMVHTSTANGGLWNSGNIAPDGRFAFTFTAAGTFPYKCLFHQAQMTGSVRVLP